MLPWILKSVLAVENAIDQESLLHDTRKSVVVSEGQLIRCNFKAMRQDHLIVMCDGKTPSCRALLVERVNSLSLIHI